MPTHSDLIGFLEDKATRLRIHSIRATTAAGSGHPTSSASPTEIVSVLFFSVMRYDPHNPANPYSDTFILSKGHAAPVLYAAWAEAGAIPESDLLNLQKIDSDLEGHPTPHLPFVDVATGSLGQGLSAGVGMALNAKYLEKSGQRIYVLLGDGETAEGAVWEAAEVANKYGLNSLCATVDINRLGQSEPTMWNHISRFMNPDGAVLAGGYSRLTVTTFHNCSTLTKMPARQTARRLSLQRQSKAKEFPLRKERKIITASHSAKTMPRRRSRRLNGN